MTRSKLPIQVINFVLMMGLLVSSPFVFSATAGGDESENAPLAKLFLDQKTRLKIDQQRAAFLYPKAKKEDKLTAKTVGELSKPKTKRIYIPPKVAISAVIVKPDGSTLIRVNNKYNQSPSKHINMHFSESGLQGVPVTVKGRTKIVPVGSTLMTRQNKVVKTYKLEEKSRKKTAIKTQQTSVKSALKQVQILTPK